MKEYDLEEQEGGDGWMILKHADSHKQQESASGTTSFVIPPVILLLRYVFF